MELSVVVATTDAVRSIEDCLRRLDRSCAGIDAELIVADASTDGTVERIPRTVMPLTLLHGAAGTLTPVLWMIGLRQARGRRIAFLTGHCLVTPRWAAALGAALDDGAAGAGGPLVRAPDISALDRAIYYLRYSAFMPQTIGAGRIAGEIAGDNAMYRRDWLERYAAGNDDGFWEVDFHRDVRAGGGWLAAVQAAVVEFGPSFPLTTILRHRFAHGAHFGAGRVRGGRRPRWQIVGAAPLVPFVLGGRAAARAMRRRDDRWPFLTALPYVLLLAAAWAAGEAHGAWRGAPV
jgi:hypothetical protein